AAIAEEFCCDDKLILVDCPDAHEGITGIVAGKLKDRYYKPVLIVTPSGEFIKGTGRSIESINLYRLLKNCDDIFEKFGGHAGACGFLMRRENLDSLKTRVELILENMLLEDQELYEKRQQADMCIAGKDITFELVSDLELLSPFGNQNPKPSFEIAHVMIEKLYYMGEDNQHVRFTGKSVDGAALSCVMFNKAGERRGLLQSGLPVRLIGSADCQEWNGSKRLQFLVEDIFENSLDCGGI
ncbi:MAG: DHHA1 domain-containing protein, partial [Anaerovorax sp.]